MGVPRLWCVFCRLRNPLLLLQDPSNRRKIIPDEQLGTILTPPVDMFSMNKQLSKHIFQAEGALVT